MPEPKYVIAMGACTITGGMFSADSTTAVRGVDKLIPVDLYLPGCPPRPEAIFDAVIKLRKKVANESILERSKAEQTHRYLTVDHEMNLVFSENTGEYLNKKSEKSCWIWMISKIDSKHVIGFPFLPITSLKNFIKARYR